MTRGGPLVRLAARLIGRIEKATMAVLQRSLRNEEAELVRSVRAYLQRVKAKMKAITYRSKSLPIKSKG